MYLLVQVEKPKKTFPLGMACGVVLVFVCNFLPVLIGTGASPEPYTAWKDGYFVRLAGLVAGPWLAYYMMFGAAIANIGKQQAGIRPAGNDAARASPYGWRSCARVDVGDPVHAVQPLFFI
jgi:hypothetical protein